MAPQEDPVSLAGVYTLPSDGAASAQAAYGNVFIAAKMSRDAIRAKSYSGQPLCLFQGLGCKTCFQTILVLSYQGEKPATFFLLCPDDIDFPFQHAAQ